MPRILKKLSESDPFLFFHNILHILLTKRGDPKCWENIKGVYMLFYFIRNRFLGQEIFYAIIKKTRRGHFLYRLYGNARTVHIAHGVDRIHHKSSQNGQLVKNLMVFNKIPQKSSKKIQKYAWKICRYTLFYKKFEIS